MTIEVLTVPNCPHRAETLARVRAALAAAGQPDAAVTERVIATADEARSAGMHGSPTVLLDGQDPFATASSEPSLSCRLYRSPATEDGAPPIAALIDALTGRSTSGTPHG